MHLDGSCYCGKANFSATSYTPHPFMRCYCSICRKTAGSGGYAINIMAQAKTLIVNGEENLIYHQALIEDPITPGEMTTSAAKRHFCRHCGSPLWVADSRWPEWIYPFASAVDSPLPTPPETYHIMVDFAAAWVDTPTGRGHVHFHRYPTESILQWHKRHNLFETR